MMYNICITFYKIRVYQYLKVKVFNYVCLFNFNVKIIRIENNSPEIMD